MYANELQHEAANRHKFFHAQAVILQNLLGNCGALGPPWNPSTIAIAATVLPLLARSRHLDPPPTDSS